MSELTQDQLKELLIYDPETGVFTWRVDRGGRGRAGNVAGSFNRDGYRQILVFKTSYKAHRLAWLYMIGAWPTKFIDHINRVKDDNRWSNLRLATMAENKQNMLARSDSASGIRGIKRSPNGKRWIAVITADSKDHYLGYFVRLEDAKAAYAAAAARLHTINPAAAPRLTSSRT